MTWIASAMMEFIPLLGKESWNTASALAMTPTAADLMIAAKRGKQYKKNDRFNKTVWYNKDRKEIEKRSKKKMKHTYDECFRPDPHAADNF